MANPPPTRTTILPRGDTSLTALFINKPFDISFDVSSSFSAVVQPTYQLCNSYTGLAPYLSGSNFKGAFPSTGFKQYLQVDALVPTGTALVSTYRSTPLRVGLSASYPAWDSNGRMYFSDNDRLIYRMTVDNSYEIFAGQVGTAGFTDGDRLTTATFTLPRGIAFDSNGDMLVAMQTNIRKINMTTGEVITLAGPNSAATGTVDGTGSAVRFNSALIIRPEFGGTGNFLVSDYANHCIRKLTPTGVVTTIVGSIGVSGFSNATGTAARFNRVADFVYTPSGDILVADQFNHRIRKVTPSYVVTTYAGNGVASAVDGPLLAAGFNTPSSIEIDPSGFFYIPEFSNHIIRRLEGPNVVTWAGKAGVSAYADGTLSNARFQSPQNLRRYGDTIYFVDSVAPFRMRAITVVSSISNFPFVNRPAGFAVMDSCSYPITVNSRIDVSWTSVGGVLPLFKFEPFSNTITANQCGGTTTDTLTYTGLTSTELLGYMAGNGTSNVTFRGPNGASTAYPYSLTLAVQAISNIASVPTVVEDVSTTVTIGTARIIYSPCNANLVFYRNEPSPAPVFSLVASDVSLIYSGTTLPTGLSFTRTGARSFALTGTPTVQTITSNYTILAFDTSSRTYATQVSMVVNPERLILDTEGSLTQSNVGTGAPIEPITFTARFPPYGLDRSMRYTWSPPPPAGIQFRDVCGTAISGSTYSVTKAYDPSFTLTLTGTITEQQLRTFAFQGCNAYSITLTGSRTSPTPVLSPSLPKTITFRFDETIFFTSNVPSLFVGLDVSGYSYTAKTYFPEVVDSSIADIAVTDGFLPDGLDASFTFATQSFAFSGRPTNASSYSFTLTASNQSGVSASLPVSTTVFNDSVTVTSLTDACFNFIQYRSLSNGKDGFYTPPMRYLVTSTSGCNATLTGTNLPTGVTLDASANNIYVLAGRPTVASGLTTATLTGAVPATGVSSTKTFQYSVSAEAFFFPRDPQDVSFQFIQNVPITPVQLDVSTLSENSVIRFSAPTIPAALQVTNTGLVQGTLQGSNAGTFDVTAFTAYTSGTKTYSYTVTPDQVLLEPTVYTTVTAPGGAVSIPINGYSLSAVTVSNYRFQSAFPYGLTINSTTGLLSGTLASSLPSSTTFTLVGSAGLVDGSLEGTMVTNNLTVNRAQLLRNEWHNYAPDYLDISSVYTYSSDDNGLTWTQRFVKKPSIYASTIGTNGSNLYLIPTSSNVVLKTTDTVSFTSNTYAASDISSHATSIVNKPGTSTWWMVGTQATSVTTRATYLYTTSNDGVTWTSNAIVGATTRDKAIDVAGQWSPYLVGGAALAYKDGVLLFGGTKILRSTDEGQTWSTVGGGFTKEVGFFSLDHDVVWIATGSDTYETLSNAAWTGTTANTICYSTDAGLTWTYAANGFNMNGYGVVYGTGAWLAYGLCNASMQYRLDTLYSLDGVNWAQVSSVAPVVGALGGTVRPGALHMALAFDETDWKVIAPTSDTSVSLYSHPYSTPLTSGWTSVDITSQFPGFGSNTELTSYTADLIDPGADVTIITFPTPTTGPTFVSPAQSTYILWQYMPIPPITFSAPGATAYFVSSLPVGLTWNSLTQTITGACMRLGTQTFTVYAKNSGITAFTVTLIVNVPRVVRKQTSAGAYTSLVRDYTEVNAAINARDTRVNPIEESALGSFASPYAPDVVTPSNCPC